MTFIETVAPEDASGLLAELYASDEATFGHIANFTRAFSLRPEAFAAWKQLNGAVRSGAGLRRYELATFTAARRLNSRYCSLAHGALIAQSLPDLLPLALGEASGEDAAVIAFATKMVDDASAITQSDVDALREHLTDAEILDVVLSVAVRCFFSTVLSALGAEPDAKYDALDLDLRQALLAR
jgi:alkylhydroperoxidase family enzyme